MRSPIRVGAVLFPIAALGLMAAPLPAAEEYARFLDGLRDRGYSDIALEYLDSMRESPLISSELKTVMPYQEGLILVDSARAERDMAAKVKLLDRARDRFGEFIKANSAHPFAPMAEVQLGNVLVERGRSLIEQSKRPSQAAKKDELIAQARAVLTEAKQVFAAAETKFLERMKNYPKFIDPKEVKKIEERDQARADLIQARLYLAASEFELAQTYPSGAEQEKTHLQAAADKYGEVYDRYRKLLAGLLARVKQGQCYQQMGDTKRALGFYSEILVQPDADSLRPLKATALHLALQCLTGESEKKYEEAVTKGSDWLANALPTDERKEEGLAIRYYTALAQKLHAESLPAEEAGKKKSELVEARKNASFVAKLPGEYQAQAKTLVRQLAANAPDEAAQEPTTFADARDRGKDALDVMQAKQAQINLAPGLKDEASIPKYKQEEKEAGERAMQYLKLALELRDEETPIDEVNIVRYYLCWLAFKSGQFYDAAVLGHFIATKYPEAGGARQSAKIAMSSYLQAYYASPEGKKDFDRDQMIEMADFITRRWASEAEASEAWTILMSIAVNERQLAKAIEYLDKIPLDSPGRGEAELKAGQALWGSYLAETRKEEADHPPQTDLDKITAQARQTLENGVGRMRAGVDAGTADVSKTLAAAQLSLGQIYVGVGQPEKALEALNDPKIGPLLLVAAKSPAVQDANLNFATETYKLALRAYVATQALEKAEQTMNDLEALIASGGDAKSAELLTRIYISLGQELEQQVKRLREEKKEAELEKVLKGFELFLQRISDRPTGNTFSSLNWVAETFYSMGSGFDTPGKPLPQSAKDYYDKAIKAYGQILTKIAADPSFAPTDASLAIKLRTAMVQRRLGAFKNAIDLLAEVLKERPSLIEAQVEAAQTYQDWGAVKDAYYTLAIQGARKIVGKDGKEEKLFWGWNLLAIKVQRDKKFNDVYYKAKLNLAKSRLAQGLKKAGPEKKAALEKALADIKLTSRLRPDMGGPAQRKEFDSLHRVIEGALGLKATGLPGDPKSADAIADKKASAAITP